MNLYKNGLTQEQVNELTKKGKTNFFHKKNSLNLFSESFDKKQNFIL